MSPIRESERARYPDYWREVSAWIRIHRADGRCECIGECGVDHADDPQSRSRYAAWGMERIPGPPERCPNLNGEPSDRTLSKVVLTVAHLNHTPEDTPPPDDAEHPAWANLKALCQGCHLRYDAPHHAETRARTRALAAAQLPLPIEEEADRG